MMEDEFYFIPNSMIFGITVVEVKFQSKRETIAVALSEVRIIR